MDREGLDPGGRGAGERHPRHPHHARIPALVRLVQIEDFEIGIDAGVVFADREQDARLSELLDESNALVEDLDGLQTAQVSVEKVEVAVGVTENKMATAAGRPSDLAIRLKIENQNKTNPYTQGYLILQHTLAISSS